MLADDLNGRLRQLLPGDDPEVVNERQYLYQQMRQLYTALEKEQKVDRKSMKKRVSRIRSWLRKDLLLHYKGTATLADAFRTGHYNDASASLLYALVFEKYEVPYYGYVDHWESYLVADPEDKEIVIRNPSARRHRPEVERTYRREYLSLVRATVAQEMGTLTTAAADSVFFKYYYQPDRRLTFGQLAAYQQLRMAQSAYTEADYADAIRLLNNALARENRPAFLVLDQASKLQLAALTRPEVEGNVTELFEQWSEDTDNRYLAAAILHHFDDRQRLLLSEDKEDEVREMLIDYQARAPAGRYEWAEQLQRLQTLRFVSYYYQKGRLDLAEQFAESLLNSDPERESYRYIVGELLLSGLGNGKSSADEIARRVELAATKYPFLRERDRYADLLLRDKAIKVRDLFSAQRESEGLKALEDFRTALLDIPIGHDRSLWTLTAFLAASTYYFQLNNYGRARQYIDEALRYNPEDHYLLHRQDVLRRY